MTIPRAVTCGSLKTRNKSIYLSIYCYINFYASPHLPTDVPRAHHKPSVVPMRGNCEDLCEITSSGTVVWYQKRSYSPRFPIFAHCDPYKSAKTRHILMSMVSHGPEQYAQQH